MQIDVDFIRSNPPRVHLGGSHVWSLSHEALRFIADTVSTGDVTVETGLGASTALFAARGAHHHCICPDPDQIALLRGYCVEHDIDLSGVTFYPRFSEEIVPELRLPETDMVLIDGGHGFPTPFIDWFYLTRNLKRGGIVIIDDTQLWTGAVLRDFLMREKAWERVDADLGSRTSAFRLVGELSPGEWDSQPFVVASSRRTRRRQLAHAAVRHLMRGEFSELFRKVGQRLC